MKKTPALLLICVFLTGIYLRAQVARLYHNVQTNPVEHIFFYPGCGENPALLLRKTGSDTIRIDTNIYSFTNVESTCPMIQRVSNGSSAHSLLWRGQTLELDSTEYVGQVSSSAVYTVRYFRKDSALLVKYGLVGSAIVPQAKKKVKATDAGGDYIFQPLSLRNVAAGWARVPVVNGRPRLSNIEIYDLAFKKMYTITDTLEWFNVQFIGKDSLLYTMVDTSRRLLRLSIREKTGRMIKATQTQLGFVVKGMSGAVFCPADVSVYIALNEKPQYAFASQLLKINLKNPAADKESFNDEIDFISTYKGEPVFHAQGAFYAPGKLVFFMNGQDFTIRGTTNVSTVLGDQLLFNKDIKANITYQVGGVYTDVQKKWIAIHVFEYRPKDLAVRKNFVIFCFPDGRNEIYESYDGYGISIMPLENGKMMIARGNDAGVIEVK